MTYPVRDAFEWMRGSNREATPMAILHYQREAARYYQLARNVEKPESKIFCQEYAASCAETARYAAGIEPFPDS